MFGRVSIRLFFRQIYRLLQSVASRAAVRYNAITMRNRVLTFLILLWLLTACAAPLPPTPTPTLTATASSTPSITASPTPSPRPTGTATLPPGVTPTTQPEVLLTPAADRPWLPGVIWLFPAGELYAGDRVTIQVPIYNLELNLPLKLSFYDGLTMLVVEPQISYNPVFAVDVILLPDIWLAQEGTHTLRIEGLINQIYALSLTTTITVHSSDRRPDYETSLAWQEIQTDCCLVTYLNHAAAARDLEEILRLAQHSYDTVISRMGLPPDEQDEIKFFLIDNQWGNGGYTSGEGVVISYIDRNYGPVQPETLSLVFLHEATHVGYFRLPVHPNTGLVFIEGTAVYLAGGHYKPEPIRERAAAMRHLDFYIPLVTLVTDFYNQQHELRYLESAAVVAYLVDTYGWDSYLEFLTAELPADLDDDLEWLETALRQQYNLSLTDFEQAFTAWLDAAEPGDQLADLALTVELQNLRRQYQFRYTPSLELYLFSLSKMEELSLIWREPDDPHNIAIETMLQNAQQAIIHADYAAAREIITAVKPAILNGDFSHPLAADHLAISQLLTGEGYHVSQIFINGDTAVVQVSEDALTKQTLQLDRIGMRWIIV